MIWAQMVMKYTKQALLERSSACVVPKPGQQISVSQWSFSFIVVIILIRKGKGREACLKMAVTPDTSDK